MLGPLFLALSLAQPYPPPPNAPPPCAAANVPGCVPGYRMTYDASGRRVYVYDPQSPYTVPSPQPRYAEPPAIPPPPPPGQEKATPQTVPAPAPQAGSAPYAPSPQPPPAPYAPAPYYPPPAPPKRGVVGLVWMPLGTTTIGGFDQPDTSHGMGAVALELRDTGSGARARFDFEYGPAARVAELALKYDFNDWGVVRPFLALGIGAGTADPDPRWRAEVAASVGVDLFLTPQLFFTAELRGRRFADLGGGDVEPPSGGLAQAAALFGIGVYL